MIIQRILNNKNFRNGALFALFSFFNTGINFVIMMVMARFIKPDSYGQLSLFTTMVSLLSIFICLNTNGFIGVNFFSSSKETAMCCFTSALEEVSGLTIVYQFYAISFCALNVMNALLLDVWRLEEKVWRYGTFSVLLVICNLILTVLFVGFLRWDWQGRMYAQVITCAGFAVLAFYILTKKNYLRMVFPKKEDFVGAYRFGIPLIPHTTSFWLRQGLDRYVINAFTTQAMVGLFSFAANFANIIQIIGSAFNASYSVNIYKTLATANIDSVKLLRRNCWYLVGVYFVITLLIFLFASLLIPFAFPQYNDCIIYLFPLCGGAMFQCFYLVYVNILFFYKRTKILMYITFTCSLLHCIMSLLLTKYGVIYTAYISLFSNMLIFMGVYGYSKRILRICFKADGD